MYKYMTIPELIQSTEAATEKLIARHGVAVYVESNPDDVAPDIYIPPLDAEGLKIYREFEAKILAHYKTLLK